MWVSQFVSQLFHVVPFGGKKDVGRKIPWSTKKGEEKIHEWKDMKVSAFKKRLRCLDVFSGGLIYCVLMLNNFLWLLFQRILLLYSEDGQYIDTRIFWHRSFFAPGVDTLASCDSTLKQTKNLSQKKFYHPKLDRRVHKNYKWLPSGLRNDFSFSSLKALNQYFFHSVFFVTPKEY